MNIKTVSDRRYMNYNYYIKQLMEIFELKLKLITAKNPILINRLD